jgi:hypothetical protein
MLRASLAVAAALPLAPLSTLGHLRAAPAPGKLGPEGIPIPAAAILGPRDSPTLGKSIDGIKCERGEHLLFHIHAHLTIFVEGKARQVPYGIGIAPPLYGQNLPNGAIVSSGSCFSWLHTHAADGLIHIESPVQRTFTLGDFFDLWNQPLTRGRVGPAHGRVVAIYDGEVWRGDPRAIPLTRHAQIQLEVGNPLVAPERLTRWGGQ